MSKLREYVGDRQKEKKSFRYAHFYSVLEKIAKKQT